MALKRINKELTDLGRYVDSRTDWRCSHDTIADCSLALPPIQMEP